MNTNKILFFLATIIIAAGCTKAKLDDDYPIGDPPPIAGGYVNSSEVAADALVAYWSFNGSTTDSVGKLQGTPSGTTFTQGQKGDALNVGGNNYLVFNSIGDVLPKLSSFTISFWYNAPTNMGLGYGYGIFSLNNPIDFWGSLDIYIDNGSNADSADFRCHFTSGTTGQFFAVKTGAAWNKWVQMTVTYDNSTSVDNNFMIYQNGSLIYKTLVKGSGSAPLGDIKLPNPNKMVIGTWQFETNPSLTTGASAQDWAGSLKGSVDEFRIYKKALNALEISALFKLEKQGR